MTWIKVNKLSDRHPNDCFSPNALIFHCYDEKTRDLKDSDFDFETELGVFSPSSIYCIATGNSNSSQEITLPMLNTLYAYNKSVTTVMLKEMLLAGPNFEELIYNYHYYCT